MKNWTGELEELSKKFKKDFAGLSREELNWTPNPGAWSIAQILEHLTRVNHSYFSVFEKLQSGKYKLPFIAKIGFLVSFFGNAIKRSVQPTNPKKMKTFGLWQPQLTDSSEACLAEFLKSQEKLKVYIKASEELIIRKQVISSPANRNIVYRLETAFDIIVLHQERHYQQALGLLDVQKDHEARTI